jgi:hypothetical protein
MCIHIVKMSPSNPASDLQAATAQRLADFMLAELDLGATFAERAKTRRQIGDAEGFERNKRNAIKAIEAVRHFVVRLRPNETHEAIIARCADLEGIVTALERRSDFATHLE